MADTTGTPPPAAPGGGGSTDTASSMAGLKEVFATAIKDNAEITKIQTQGNTSKRAASAVPS